MQVAELMELLVILGHEADAATLQSALDAHVKGFIATAEEILANPVPPENGAPSAVAAAERTAMELRSRLHGLRKATWKWELLRPA